MTCVTGKLLTVFFCAYSADRANFGIRIIATLKTLCFFAWFLVTGNNPFFERSYGYGYG